MLTPWAMTARSSLGFDRAQSHAREPCRLAISIGIFVNSQRAGLSASSTPRTDLGAADGV